MRAKAFLSAALVAASVVLPGIAGATTFTGTWSVDVNSTDPGLVIETYPSSGSFSTSLEVGDSVTGKLFSIWTNETDVGPDDQIPKPISMAASFSSPDSFGGILDGETTGVRELFGFVQSGELTWDGPLTLAFGAGDTGRVTLALSDAAFNWGLFGLNEGPKWGANVYGTITYDVAPVPVPAALPMLLGAFGILGFAARRRLAA